MARSQNLHLCRKITSDCTHQLDISDSSRASTLERICLNQFFNLLLLLAGDLPLKRSLNLQSKDLPLSRRDFHHPCMTSRHAGRRALSCPRKRTLLPSSLAPEKEINQGRSHLLLQRRDYIKAAKPFARTAAIGATASHAFSAESYRSTELRRSSSLKPPTAYSLPSSNATA